MNQQCKILKFKKSKWLHLELETWSLYYIEISSITDCSPTKIDSDMDELAAEFIPAHFLTLPPLRDSLQTQTSQLQEATEKECMPLLNAANDPSQNPFNFNEYGVPQLISEAHVSFLEENLGRFPAPFVGLDASRPWMVYWALLGFYYLGKDVTSYRVRYSIFPISPNPFMFFSYFTESKLITLLVQSHQNLLLNAK